MEYSKLGILEIRDDKIQVQSNRLSMLQNEMFFLITSMEWVHIEPTFGETFGIATIEEYREECKDKQMCLKQHVGFYWSPKWNLWFCLNSCPYNFHSNFIDGMLE